MTTLIATVAAFALVMLALGLGVLFGRRPLQGSCGGVGRCSCGATSEADCRATLTGMSAETRSGETP